MIKRFMAALSGNEDDWDDDYHPNLEKDKQWLSYYQYCKN
jgi:hypothetical protein